MKTLKAVTVVIVVACLCVGCGSNEPKAKPESAAKSSASTQISLPVPSPVATCDGVSGQATANDLVEAGQAVAVVVVTISGSPGPVENNVRYVPVDSSKVVAGGLDADLQQIEESSSGPNDNLLPAGQYMVLIGGSQKTQFYLADGLRGSFAIDGTSAYERCANADNPSQPIEVKTGVVDQAVLTGLFTQAIKVDTQQDAPAG
jgi:hypothetical protein